MDKKQTSKKGILLAAAALLLIAAVIASTQIAARVSGQHLRLQSFQDNLQQAAAHFGNMELNNPYLSSEYTEGMSCFYAAFHIWEDGADSSVPGENSGAFRDLYYDLLYTEQDAETVQVFHRLGSLCGELAQNPSDQTLYYQVQDLRYSLA